MEQLWVALALVLVIEGALYALFPQQMIDTIRKIQDVPVAVLRATGLVAMALGWIAVWWLKS
ncbi:MAG: DUF2065 domain-containing protein [Mariprofundaceae bacterium]